LKKCGRHTIASALPSGPAAPDPKDSDLLALAEGGQAEFIVTGDKELLAFKHHKSARIITAVAMIEILKREAAND
jgi:predicted nucleic acid-binding protein